MYRKYVLGLLLTGLWVGAVWAEKPKLTSTKQAKKRTTRVLRRASPSYARTQSRAEESQRLLPYRRRQRSVLLENKDGVAYTWRIQCKKAHVKGHIVVDGVIHFRARRYPIGQCRLEVGRQSLPLAVWDRFVIRKGTLHKRNPRVVVFPPIAVVGDVSLTRDKQLKIMSASSAKASSEWSTTSYQASQLTGAPNAKKCQDNSRAWASKTADKGREWLSLTYKQNVRAIGVLIHENWKPGAVVAVQAKTGAGWVTVWRGKDPAKGVCPAVFAVRFQEPVDTNRVRIILDTKKVTGWNEIDAVQLVYRER